MENLNRAQENFNKIEQLIKSSRYNESFLLLSHGLSSFETLKNVLEDLKKTELTYRYMLDYIAEGNFDPNKEEMIDQIRESLISSNDILLRANKLKDNGDIYSSTRRFFDLQQARFSDLLQIYKEELNKDISSLTTDNDTPKISKEQLNALSELFNYIWTLSPAANQEYEALSNSLIEETLPDYFKAQMISALILNNLAYFNPTGFELLLNLYEKENPSFIQARLITGLILISLLYPNRVKGNIDLRSHFMLVADNEEFSEIVNEVLINIIRTFDTKRVDDKMRNEVIPGLMKLKPDILNKMKDLSSDAENFLEGENPEWEELIENSEVGDKLREINEMQLEGADVMVTAFSNLKSFPFFSKISNWFLPFTPGNSEFSDLNLNNNEDIISRFITVMCDSDIHSFLFSLKSMPEEKRDIMMNNMNNQMKELKEATENSVGLTPRQLLSLQIKHSLQDIYRFFKFFRKKEDFKDPFNSPYGSSNLQPLIQILKISSDEIRILAEFYFKNKYYEVALDLFQLLDSMEPGNFSNWEKIGYCNERLKRYKEAAEWYEKAELINPGVPWLEKRLAISLKNSNQNEKAIKYYEKALINEPDNYHLLMSAGQCYLSGGDLKAALNHFYHAQYLKPEKHDNLRAIAWTELLNKNFEKANSAFSKLLEFEEPDKSDYLNAAHATLASGDFKKALNLYKTYIEKTESKDIKELVLAFKEDSDTMKNLGIRTSDLRLIIDKIRYDMFS